MPFDPFPKRGLDFVGVLIFPAKHLANREVFHALSLSLAARSRFARPMSSRPLTGFASRLPAFQTTLIFRLVIPLTLATGSMTFLGCPLDLQEPSPGGLKLELGACRGKLGLCLGGALLGACQVLRGAAGGFLLAGRSGYRANRLLEDFTR